MIIDFGFKSNKECILTPPLPLLSSSLLQLLNPLGRPWEEVTGDEVVSWRSKYENLLASLSVVVA